MSENILPDGFSRWALTTGSRMWVGPDTLAEPMVVYAMSVGDDEFKAVFTDGSGEANRPRVEFLSGEALESAALAHCRELAVVTA